MKVFVDTSAFLSILDRSDPHHEQADQIWRQLLAQENTALYCTNYVLLESIALIQNRLGMSFVTVFQAKTTPVLTVKWVDETLHQAGVLAIVTANRRQLGLVDCVSFAAMRELNIQHCFAFDAHFYEQGFTKFTL